MRPARIAFLHLVRRSFSTLVVLLGITLAVATSGLLLRLHELSKERFVSIIHTGDAIIGAKSGAIDLLLGQLNFEGEYPTFIPFNLYQTLKSQETVRFEDNTAATPQFVRQIFPFVLFAKADRFRVYATSEDFFKAQEAELPVLAEGAAPLRAGEIVLGSDVAKSLGLKVGDTLPAAAWLQSEPSSVEAWKWKVVGIYQKSTKAWDRIALATWGTAEKVFSENQVLLRTPWKDKVLHFMLVYVNPNGFIPLQNLINQRTVAQAIAVDTGFAKLNDLTGTGRELGLVVAGVILILSMVSVGSMMMGRFESMNVQLAVLRALGYSRADLSKVLLYEALFLSLVACLVGALIDAGLFGWLTSLLGANLPAADVASVGIGRSWPIWVAVLWGNVLSVLYPIWRISKQNIHMSLRSL